MRSIPRWRAFLLWMVLLPALPGAAPQPRSGQSPVLGAMEQELERTWKDAKRDPEAPLYFLGYTITETRSEVLGAARGALTREDTTRDRVLDVSARVGAPELDNTHQLRGGEGGRFGFGGAAQVPIDDDAAALRAAIWQATDAKIKAAQERYLRVRTNQAVKVEEERPAPDFSREEPQVHVDALPALDWDRAAWRNRVRDLSRHLRQYSFVLEGGVTLGATTTNTFQANSEGTRLQFGQTHVRLRVSLEGIADDGTRLERGESFDAQEFSGLPSDAVVTRTLDRLAGELEALRRAPDAEPYTGPAILRNRAAGVFFHEIFGHRIEGHRQKLSDEGQTFTAKVGEPILPSFLSVVDDPSMPRAAKQDLNGHYPYDDEGVPAQRVTLVDHGVLKSFLLARSPLPGFPNSNGHGRRQPGREVVARQGNLMVLAAKQVPYAELRRMLIAECKRQQKPYGLIFDDISGGFTNTDRSGPQAFKVLPLLVTRVFTDGRPDQVVRGVDIVGTPLSSFAKIIAAADDTDVFNGYCGAESGFVPVSAIAPSLLLSEIEVEKRAKGTSRPPLLAAPALGSQKPSTEHRAPSAEHPLPADDPTLRAMADELERSRTQLKMDPFAPPYFVAYTAQDLQSVSVNAALGALVSSDQDRGRRFWADVRVGDASLDNSNFGGQGRFGGVATLPLEPDEESTRRTIWLATDEAYKDAIETLSRKRAALQNQAQEDRPPDLGKVAPFTLAAEPPLLDVDRAAWENTARAVSGVFRRYPALEDGRLSLRAERAIQRFVNSEGSWHRTGGTLIEVTLRASARASDGTTIADLRRFHVRRAADLPSREQLTAAATELAQGVTELATAKKSEEYSGPILFTGEAAAVFFDRLVAEKLADPAVPVSDGGRAGQRPDKLTGQLGRRILPAGFRVVDDPTKDALDGVPLLGGYAVDDDGAPAAPVTLVEDGLLKAFYMSRIPTKEIPDTNGHGRRGLAGRVTGQPANLVITAAGGSADLKERLRALCRDENLPYGLLVERFETTGGGGGGFGRGFGRRGPRGRGPGAGFGAAPEDRSDLPDPIGFRRIYVDGHEEVVRGGRIVGVTSRTLRGIAAAGSTPNVMTRRLSGLGPAAVTIVAPSIVVTSLDVRPAEGSGERPPLIERPILNVGKGVPGAACRVPRGEQVLP